MCPERFSPVPEVLVAALVFVATFASGMAVCWLVAGERSQVARRLRNIQRMGLPEPRVGLPKVAIKGPTRKTPLTLYTTKLARRLERARLLYRPHEFALLCLTAAALGAIGGYGRTRNLSFGLICAAVGYAIPNLYLSARERKQRALLGTQVGDMVMLLGNYLRAGHGFSTAMELLSREIMPPLQHEVKRFTRDLRLGANIKDALLDLEARAGDPDLSLAVTAIIIQHEVGGNLAEILDNINYTIRERVRLSGEIRALTAQGRLTAAIISMLPVAMGAFIFLANPSYFSVMLTTVQGKAMLAFAAVAELLGVLIIRRIVSIKV